MHVSDPQLVSVIIPVYNDPSGLRDTLETVLTQTYTHLEVIVAVTPADGATIEVAQSIARSNSGTVSIVTEKTPGPAAGRNAAIRDSNGGILCFLDSNMTVEKGYVESAVQNMEADKLDYAGCDVELLIPDGKETIAARFDKHTGFPMKEYIKYHEYAPTCALFVRRSVFLDIGLFDDRLTAAEDLEFGNRVKNAGYKLVFLPDVTAYHPTRNSLRELIKKDRRVGSGLCQLQRYHPDRYGTPGIPPRPSGIKRPDQNLQLKERIEFSIISIFLTGVRGQGYYQEYVRGEEHDGVETIPKIRR